MHGTECHIGITQDSITEDERTGGMGKPLLCYTVHACYCYCYCCFALVCVVSYNIILFYIHSMYVRYEYVLFVNKV